MQKPDLTRRQLLSGIAVTGGAGALTGRGTAALFTDEETFTNNAVSASTTTAGVVALDVDIDSLDDADGLVYTISVPDMTNNNPSYVWVQPATCPEPIEEAAKVDVELRLERNDGSDDVVISQGTLKSVINELREDKGAVLRSVNDDPRCFGPGESVDLVLEVISSETDADFDFELEFYAEQCRYTTGTNTPFEPLDPCDSGQTNGISFIAFCSESDEALEPEVVDTMDPDEDGAPTSAEWETTSDVDYVVAKSGQNFTIYDYQDEETTGDTVTTGGDVDALYTSDPSNSQSSAPCELAAAEFGSDPSQIETSIKLEFEGETFVPEDDGGGNSGDGGSDNSGNGNNGNGRNSSGNLESPQVRYSA